MFGRKIIMIILSGVLIMFWNLENFFDHRDGGYSSSDAEFSAAGSRHWTFGRLLRKCEGIAKTIFLAAEEAGGLPDIIGFAEVENKAVLYTLLKRTLLDKCGYKIVHFESPDRRGIDVALIYRAEALALRAARPVRITAAQGQDSLRTRDILLAEFLQQGGVSFSVAVNHHPSKFGGGESQWRRLAALEALGLVRDSLAAAGDSLFVACGDFNDDASNEVFADFAAKYSLKHPAAALSAAGEGTIRFDGRWELIDFFLFDKAVEAQMKILRFPHLLTRDNVHSGEKPLRTYSGPRYLGGLSDHLPILLSVKNLPNRQIFKKE